MYRLKPTLPEDILLTIYDMTEFWKGVKKNSNSNVFLATNVDGSVGNTEIAEMWKCHYKSLLNSVQNKEFKKSATLWNLIKNLWNLIKNLKNLQPYGTHFHMRLHVQLMLVILKTF